MIRAVWLILSFFVAAPLAAQSPVTVFAAASLNGALEAALADYPRDVRVSYGGSGAIARQVSLGAPADLVILAHPEWDDWLEARVASQDHVPALLRNRLVLVAPFGSAPFAATPTSDQLQARLGAGRLAMGQRDTVPAGQYGRAWLTSINAWDDTQSKLAEVENVRTALAYVARAEAPLGIVYASDAALEDRVEVIWQIKDETHTPIRYPARAFTQRGRALLEYLTTVEAQSRFALWGFRPGEDLK